MFTIFGRGRLNCGGDRRARLYGGKVCSFAAVKNAQMQVWNWNDNCQHSSSIFKSAAKHLMLYLQLMSYVGVLLKLTKWCPYKLVSCAQRT